MVFDIKIYHVAEQELANAVRWYERESSGLGRRFFKEFLKIKETLSRTPSIYQILSSNTRRANFKNFPYSVIYSIDENVVSIYSIFHHKRNPSNII